MSIIKNTGIKRGDKLTATDLNAEFTSVNSAFKMDAENFRNEAIDSPSLKGVGASGQAGIILKDAATYTLFDGTLTVNANSTADTSAPVAATEIGSQAVPIVAKANDIFRVYWQYDFTTIGNGTSLPYAATPPALRVGYCWAIWLEWKTSPSGSYTPVAGQSDLDNAITVSSATKYGGLSADMRATSLDYHAISYENKPSGVYNSNYPGRRGGYGQYYYKFPSDTTLYGLRLMVRGLYEPVYATTSNAIKSLQADATVHKFELYRAELSFLLMRNE